MTVSLKDDISTALKNPNSALKIETLEKMKQVVVKTGSLGKLEYFREDRIKILFRN